MNGADAERDELKSAIVAFLERWDEVSPGIDAAFVMAHIHGQRYSGPTLEAELDTLRRLVGMPPKPRSR